MKIAMIGAKGVPAKSGGVERHVEEAASRLSDGCNEVAVYCRSTYQSYEPDEYKGIKLKSIKTINNKNLNAIVYTFKATMDAIKHDYDVIHYHAIGPASLCFIPKLRGKKVVVTVHGPDWKSKKWGRFAKAYLKLGEKMAVKYADRIICVSNNLKAYLIDKYKCEPHRIEVIPNGVTPINVNGQAHIEKYGLEKGNYILFLARLVPEKGAHYLIDSYNGLNTYKKLVIAGGSSFTDDYVKELKSKGQANKNIVFTGSVHGDELDELYHNCYIYVLPSDIEGMPITLLEAMSFGKCCLASDIEANREVIGEDKYGILFKQGSIESLKEKLRFLLENEDLVKHIGALSRKYVERKYNWDNIIKQILDVYMCAIQGRR